MTKLTLSRRMFLMRSAIAAVALRPSLLRASLSGFTTGNYLTGTAPVTAVPLSMACWFNAANITATHNLVSLNRTSDNSTTFGISAGGSVGGDPIQAYTNSQIATTSTGYAANVWNHAGASFASATSRAAYLNGGGRGTNTGSATPTNITRLCVGIYFGSSASSPLTGSIAEVGIWNAVLTDEEFASLASGLTCLKVRPNSLVAYIPCVSGARDLISGVHLTMTGTVNDSTSEPRVYR